jgi:hypothetical protein
MNWPFFFWIAERLAFVALGSYTLWLFWPVVSVTRERRRRFSGVGPPSPPLLHRSQVRRVARERLSRLGLGLARTPSPLKSE